MSLKILCRPFPVLFNESSYSYHSIFFLLIWPCIFSLAYLSLISGCIWLPYQMYLRAFILIYPSSDSSSVDDSSIESKIDSPSYKLHLFSTKLHSSKYSKVIMSPFCSWDDVAYGIYKTAGCVMIASEYGRDIYANALEKYLSNTTSCEETIFRVLGT